MLQLRLADASSVCFCRKLASEDKAQVFMTDVLLSSLVNVLQLRVENSAHVGN